MKTLKFLIYALLCLSIGTTKAQTDIHNFTNGEFPTGSLTPYVSLSNVHYLLGMTPYGGNSYNDGLIFEYNLNTNTYTTLYDFSGGDGANPFGGLVVHATGTPPAIMFYGMTYAGGSGSGATLGTIFYFDPNIGAVNTIHTFTGTGGTSDGANPYGSLVTYTTTGGTYLLGMTSAGGLYNYGMIFSCLSTYPYTFTDLHDFNGTDGLNPYGDLTLVENNGDAVVYGMTNEGGPGNIYFYSYYGNIFSYDLITNTFTDMFDFNGGTDGSNPYGNVLYTATAGGTLYGMTELGGSDSKGTLFSYNIPSNTETVLLNFYCSHPPGCIGEYPYGSLAMAGNELYGMTSAGGTVGPGLIFSYDPYTNSLNSLGNFTGSNGSTPYYGSVTLEKGVLYGMAKDGGSGGDGVIFQLGTISAPICDVGMDTSATITCSGYGSVSVSPFYGVTPYTYSWAPSGGNSATATGLTANSYTVTVTDANGCSATQSMVLSQPAALTLSLSNQYCDHVSNTGGGSVNPSGGTSPYTYLWEPGGEHGADQVGLSGGTYTITVTDYNGCTATITMNICGVHGASRHEQEEDSITQIMNGISLYPNPSNGQFTITGLQSGMYIEVYDYTGRLVRNTTVSIENMQVNLSEMPNGIYLVRMMSAGGTLVKQTKIVKVE